MPIVFLITFQILSISVVFSQYRHIRLAEPQNLSNYKKTSPDFIGNVAYPVLDRKKDTYTDWVDPFVGTSGHGHTFPGATTPFGMVQVSADNGIYGWDWCSGYHYSDNEIMFFSHKHLSGTGATDLGDIGFMPFSGKYETLYGFSHQNEYARPGYYAVKLNNGILCEFTVTPRGAIHRYTFPDGADKHLEVDLTHSVSGDQNLKTEFRWVDEQTFGGLRQSKGWASNQRCYFIAKTNQKFTYQEKNGKATLSFTGDGNVIEVRVALSTVSIENATMNLDAEIGDHSFDEIFVKADAMWEEGLSKIEVEAPANIKTTFYTALYHTMIAPNLLSDVNGAFSDPDGTVIKAVGYQRYSTFSLWDTYRAAHSLFIFLRPDLVDDFVQSMLAHYDYRGKLPIWELEGNETFCMIGNHAIPVIAEAWQKGIRNFDGQKALQACLETATQDFRGLKQYNEMGYVPYDVEGESVSKTLEYAYNDWAVAKLAESLGHTDIARAYYARANNYKNLFDKSTGLMRPKDKNGKWLDPFDPLTHKKGSVKHYTEGNAWQYTWSVQQYPVGLAALYGSPGNFEKQLDSLFTLKHDLKESERQVDVTGLIGQYAHGNEPSHHTAYLYNYTNDPWKTQEMVRRICKEFYTDKPDGLCGNEDCGQMSAWYIFSALGFYPINPVSGKYELGSPLIDKATMHLANGKVLTITAKNQSPENVYVKKVELNGLVINGLQITHDQIMAGGELVFTMSDTH